VQSNSVVSSKPNTTAKSIDPKPTPIAQRQAIRQVTSPAAAVPQQKELAALSTPNHSVRRNSEEDDYVAKDTYVFYGSSGKPSR